MILENVLGTFEVDEDNGKIKAVSLVDDEALNKLLSIQYNRSRHDYLPQYTYVPLETDTHDLYDWRPMLINAFKQGQEFAYYSDKSRYYIKLDVLFPIDVSITGKRKTPYIINKFAKLWDKGVSVAYALPLDFETMERVLEQEDFTSPNGTDIIALESYLQYTDAQSEQGISRFETVLNVADCLEIVDIFKKQVQELHRQIGSFQEKYIGELERLTKERDAARAELAALKGKVAIKAQPMKTANKTMRLPFNPQWNAIRLTHLFDELQKGGFIGEKTSLDVFLYPFGYGNLKTNDEKVKWAKRASLSKYGSKKSLLDLLQQMGYRRPPISVKCIKDIFDFDNVRREFGQPDMRPHGDLSMPINEEYYDELAKILSKV